MSEAVQVEPKKVKKVVKVVSPTLGATAPPSQPPNNRVYILYDKKLNAIIGVFSSSEKMREARNKLIRNDLTRLVDSIENELALTTGIEDDVRQEMVGVIYQIHFLLTYKPNELDSTIVCYKGNPINCYYFVYSMELDSFNIDKPFYSSAILLPTKK